MSKNQSERSHFGLQAPAALKTKKRLAGESAQAFEQLVDRPPDEVADEQPPAPPRRPKVDHHGDTILYEAGDALLQPDAWPAVVEPGAAENGHSLTTGSLDGDSAVVLVDVINALQKALDERHAFAVSTAGGARLDENSLEHLIRFVIRSAGPMLVEQLSLEDANLNFELQALLGKTRFGTSVVRERAEAEKARWKAEREKARAEDARLKKLRAKAEAAVVAEEAKARAAKVEEKLAALTDAS